jgi:guanylate kinase
VSGSVTVVSGPTAVGKGTLVAELARRFPEVWVSVSATTRAPRPGEVDGVHYQFVDDAAFDRLVAEGGLLEWARVHGDTRYGTPRAPVEEAVARGRQVILEIDLQGARQVRASYPQARFVFIAPPDRQALLDRLRQRGTETPEQIARRLRTAEEELRCADEFDHVVVNDVLSQTVEELVDLLGLGHPGRPS